MSQSKINYIFLCQVEALALIHKAFPQKEFQIDEAAIGFTFSENVNWAKVFKIAWFCSRFTNNSEKNEFTLEPLMFIEKNRKNLLKSRISTNDKQHDIKREF